MIVGCSAFDLYDCTFLNGTVLVIIMRIPK